MNQADFLDALLALPELEEPKVSRDGRWVAWTWYRAGPAADVYAAPVDGSSAPIRLTDTADDTLLISWTPDSRSLLVSQDHQGDERAQLFRVRLEQPGVMEPLTEASPSFFLRGGQLHPNGRWLIYGANWDEARGEEIVKCWPGRNGAATMSRS
jgi:Tol biopolymer transport system component